MISINWTVLFKRPYIDKIQGKPVKILLGDKINKSKKTMFVMNQTANMCISLTIQLKQCLWLT